MSLNEALQHRLPGQVIFDYALNPVDWVGELIETVRRSELVLVLMGPRWLDALSERIAAGTAFSDAVHIELLAALRYDVPLIAVLVEDSSLPTPSSLPAELSPLADVTSVRLRHSDWETDLDTLVEEIERNRVSAS
jgi:hypothetical protein